MSDKSGVRLRLKCEQWSGAERAGTGDKQKPSVIVGRLPTPFVWLVTLATAKLEVSNLAFIWKADRIATNEAAVARTFASNMVNFITIGPQRNDRSNRFGI